MGKALSAYHWAVVNLHRSVLLEAESDMDGAFQLADGAVGWEAGWMEGGRKKGVKIDQYRTVINSTGSCHGCDALHSDRQAGWRNKDLVNIQPMPGTRSLPLLVSPSGYAQNAAGFSSTVLVPVALAGRNSA